MPNETALASVTTHAKRCRTGVFGIGALIGLLASSLVVLLDKVDPFLTPTWQLVLFYPGYLAGNSYSNCCRDWYSDSYSDFAAAILVGVLTTALEYGLLALLVGAVYRRLRPRDVSATIPNDEAL